MRQIPNLENLALSKGFTYAADTSAHAGPFCAIYVLAQAVLTTLTAATGATITGTITGVTLPAGMWLYGKFTTFTLASGSVIAYNSVL